MIFMAHDPFSFLDEKLGVCCEYGVHVKEKDGRNFFHQLTLEAGEPRSSTGADSHQHCVRYRTPKWLPTSEMLIHWHCSSDWYWQGAGHQ